MTKRSFIGFIGITLSAIFIAISTHVLAMDWLINSYRFAAGAATPTLTYVTTTENDTSLTTYTFTAVNTGTADATRKTIVAISGGDSATDFSIASVTVGGAAATEVIDSANTGSTVQTAIYIIDNPSGTTANIVVTLSEAGNGCGIAVWAAYDLSSSTATDTATQFQSTAANIVLSLDISAGGVAVGIASTMDNASTGTWTGLTERAEEIVGADDHMFSPADTTSAGGAAPLTVGADWSLAADSIGVSASFR